MIAGTLKYLLSRLGLNHARERSSTPSGMRGLDHFHAELTGDLTGVRLRDRCLTRDRPIEIKTKGIFSEKGEARIWLTDDVSRVMVKMQAKVAFGTLTMSLTSVRRGAPEEVIAKAG